MIYTNTTLVVFSGEKMKEITLMSNINKCRNDKTIIWVINLGFCLYLSYLLLIYEYGGILCIYIRYVIGVKSMHAHLGLFGYFCCLR